MKPRLVLFSMTAALLYVGPFLAGLTGSSIVLLPVFAAIFVIWVVLMRPAIWSKVTEGGTPLGLAMYLGGITILQMLLVVLAFALGRGLGTLTGDVSAIPQWLPPLLSLAALPIGRLIWTPDADLTATEAFLDEQEAALGWTDKKDSDKDSGDGD